jgi:hypothetical protein
MTETMQEGKTRPLTNPEKNNAQQVAKLRGRLGGYSSVQKSIATYAKMTTKHRPKTIPEIFLLAKKNIRESIVELEQRIRWVSEREVPSAGDSRLAKEQRRFWSNIKTDFEAVRATYLVALERLERLERAEAELGLLPRCLSICAQLSKSLRERLTLPFQETTAKRGREQRLGRAAACSVTIYWRIILVGAYPVHVPETEPVGL